MTGQFPDTVDLDGTEYSISAVDGTGLFVAEEHGFRPRFLSSACWRGHICAYAVRDDQLLLDQLTVGVEPYHPTVTLHGRTPRTASRRAHYPGAAIYRDLAMPVPFTGRLLLGADLDLYTHMGFQPAWYYQRVIELEVNGGRVNRRTDRSAEMAEVRRRHREGLTELGHQREHVDGPMPSEADLEDYVTRTFSLDYRYSWPDA